MFEPNPTKAVDLLVQHSGGKISTALRMAIERGTIKNGVSQNTDRLTEPTMIDKVNDESKEIPLSKEKKSLLDCFDCWRDK